MPRNAATRDAQPCCSPICAGMRQSTPSTSSRATPQSSMARFAASRQKPIALTPGHLAEARQADAGDRVAVAQPRGVAHGSRAAAPGWRCRRPCARRSAFSVQMSQSTSRTPSSSRTRGDGALAGDDVARPGELGEAGAELAHVADARRVAPGTRRGSPSRACRARTRPDSRRSCANSSSTWIGFGSPAAGPYSFSISLVIGALVERRAAPGRPATVLRRAPCHVLFEMSVLRE